MAEREGLALNDNVERIRVGIEESKEEISETVGALEEKIRSSLDWREQVARYPLASLGVAAGIGFLVSAIFRPRPSPGERLADAFSEIVDEVSHRTMEGLEDLVPDSPRRRPGIVRMAAGLAASRFASEALSRQAQRFWGGGRTDAGTEPPPAEGPVGATYRPFE